MEKTFKTAPLPTIPPAQPPSPADVLALKSSSSRPIWLKPLTHDRSFRAGPIQMQVCALTHSGNVYTFPLHAFTTFQVSLLTKNTIIYFKI